MRGREARRSFVHRAFVPAPTAAIQPVVSFETARVISEGEAAVRARPPSVRSVIDRDGHSYALLILVRGVVSGLDQVPADAVEAASGMGFAGGQRLARVELPLAAPVIIAALRLATVSTVGLVMVTALIGEGGLGQLMLRGFNRSFPTMIYVGLVMSVVIAVALDLLLVLLRRLLTPWTRAGDR